MRVTINHKPAEAQEGETLGALLNRLGLNRPATAVAVDNGVVPRDRRDDFPLAEGMKITIITAVCGG